MQSWSKLKRWRPDLLPAGMAGVELWRTLWEGRDVCVVTGEDSRFELLLELFDNVASVRYMRSVPVDAYADVARLTDEIGADRDPEHLHLVSSGPAGAVLAAELSSPGSGRSMSGTSTIAA